MTSSLVVDALTNALIAANTRVAVLEEHIRLGGQGCLPRTETGTDTDAINVLKVCIAGLELENEHLRAGSSKAESSLCNQSAIRVMAKCVSDLDFQLGEMRVRYDAERLKVEVADSNLRELRTEFDNLAVEYEQAVESIARDNEKEHALEMELKQERMKAYACEKKWAKQSTDRDSVITFLTGIRAMVKQLYFSEMQAIEVRKIIGPTHTFPSPPTFVLKEGPNIRADLDDINGTEGDVEDEMDADVGYDEKDTVFPSEDIEVKSQISAGC